MTALDRTGAAANERPLHKNALLDEIVSLLAAELAPAVANELERRSPKPSPACGEPWRLLDVEEVAAILGRSRRWVHGAVKERGLPYLRLDGGALAFDPEDVRAWAQARRVPAAEPDPLAGRWQEPRNPVPGEGLDGRRRTVMQKAEAP